MNINNTPRKMISNSIFTLAIDGPSGVGKSSTASKLASNLHFIRIDSGTLYRAITYILLQKYDTLTNDLLLSIKENIEKIEIEITTNQILYMGTNIKPFLRETCIEKNVVIIARMPFIREKIKAIQHKIIESMHTDEIKGVVIDGRDIGTVVLPNADLKIFLTATKEIRAMRRWNEKDRIGNYEDLLKQMEKRDYEDINREIAPLKQAEDAIVVDNSELSFLEQVELIEKLVLAKMNEKNKTRNR